MPWILSKTRVVIVGLFIFVLAPWFVFAVSVAEESPEAVIQLFYKALYGGKYVELQKYLTRYSVEELKKEEGWKSYVDFYAKGTTLQTVEVGEVVVKDEKTIANVVTRFADGSSQKLRLGLVKEKSAWKIIGINKLEVEQTFRDYVFRIYDTEFFVFRDNAGSFEIFQDGHFISSSYITSHNFTNLTLIGKDITGNGIPNLVVEHYSGGSAGFAIYNIYEIGQKFREIARIDGYMGTKFADLNGDSKLEIVLSEYEFKSLAECNGCYRPPKVILRYQDGAYRIAVDLMRKPAPSSEDLEKRAQQAREDTFWKEQEDLVRNYGKVPESLYVTMFELLYSGHPDLAWQFFEMAWPLDVSGKGAWISKFRGILAGSQYWPLDSKRAYFVP